MPELNATDFVFSSILNVGHSRLSFQDTLMFQAFLGSCGELFFAFGYNLALYIILLRLANR